MKQATATQTPVEKAPKKAAVKKSAAKKAPAKKPPVKKAPVKKAAAKKAPVKKPAAKNTPAKKAASKAAASKAPATERTEEQAAPVTKKSAPAKKTAAKKTSQKETAANTTPAPKTPAPATAPATAPKTAAKGPAKKSGSAAAAPDELVVLEAEDPWTKAELKEVRAQLNDDVVRLTNELAEVEGDLAGMIENSGEGAGHDQADVGSASFERDQEMVIVNNARDMLEQSEHALARIADGTYGQCENCGNPIGKNRLMAFPRATLCLSCKQREERR